jgi:stage IV sporulation protein FB
MIKIPGRIPITIFPAFWIFSALIGFVLSGGDFMQMFVWIGIIFVSVLFHEFGHALTALAFGQTPRIDLVAMGGLTYHDGEKLAFWKQFVITLNGPIFGFVLAVAAFFLVQVIAVKDGYFGRLLANIYGVNMIWTIVNLLPILPLDGGQLMRIILEKIFHIKGVRYTLIVSSLIAVAISLFLFISQNFLPAAIFFLFAFENFDSFRRTSGLREIDRSDKLKKELSEAETKLRQGNKQEALHAFERLRAEAKEGMIHILSSQYLAFLDYEIGKGKEAYEMLFPLKDQLEPEALCLLHRVAFEANDFKTVLELAGSVFQYTPEAEVALRSAYASATMGEVQSTIGWLQTALQCGVENLKEIVLEKSFDSIRNQPDFQAFLSTVSG